MARHVAVVTTSRADYAILYSVLRRMRAHPALRTSIVASGMHLSPRFGLTVRDIEHDGFEVADRVEMLLAGDSPDSIAASIGIGIIRFSSTLARLKPDLLLLLGDRFEVFAAAVAALPHTIPVAHIHGGEATLSAFDESIRHAITRLSHLHFVSTTYYADRILNMGEEPWRIHTVGAPALDMFLEEEPAGRDELRASLGVTLNQALLVVFHPVTLQHTHTSDHIGELLAALEDWPHEVIFIHPNADTANSVISEMIAEFCDRHRQCRFVASLDRRSYAGLLGHVSALVGNSSSGLIEAPLFRLPVVNIGSRQEGRLRARNVIDVGHSRQEIIAGIRRAVSEEFRASLADLQNPYGSGGAAAKIVEVIGTIPLETDLLRKRYAVDVPAPATLGSRSDLGWESVTDRR